MQALSSITLERVFFVEHRRDLSVLVSERQGVVDAELGNQISGDIRRRNLRENIYNPACGCTGW